MHFEQSHFVYSFVLNFITCIQCLSLLIGHQEGHLTFK